MDKLDLEARLNSKNNVLNSCVVVDNFTNRVGRKNINFNSKELIGTLSHFDTQKNVAKAFGVSQAFVSDVKNGINNSNRAGSFDPTLKNVIDSNVKDEKKKVSSIALERLTRAIESVTDEKLEIAKLTELSPIISSLGKVAGLDETNNNPNQNNFVFYAPRSKNEDDYEVIEVH